MLCYKKLIKIYNNNYNNNCCKGQNSMKKTQIKSKRISKKLKIN